jgi:catalase (peroxidase I)
VILSNLASIPSEWDAAFQYVNVIKGSLCLKMLPSDVTLLQDERYSKWVHLYCKNCQSFLESVKSAFMKLDQEPKEGVDEVSVQWISSS